MKKKRTKRIMFLFIVTLLLLLLVKCSKNFNTSNPISHEINKTINDSKKSIEETEPTGEGSKDEEAKKATESNKSNTKSENKSNSSSTSNKNNSSSNTGSSNKPSSGSNNKNSSSNKNNGSNSSSSSNSNKGGSSSSSSSKPSSGSNNSNSGSSSNNKPSHTHNWVNVTKTVNHPAKTHQEDVYENRQVKVKDAWDEKVYVKTVKTCRQCGFSTSNPSEMTNHMLENGHSCSSQDIYKTVHHDAVYETKRVKTGTKTVVDKPAWTETVVIGKKCTSCGATKKE
mgnify:CR=1 FL=1